MYRAYIAQHKYRVVLDGIAETPSTPTGLKGIRKVAEYFNSIGKLNVAFNAFVIRWNSCQFSSKIHLISPIFAIHS